MPDPSGESSLPTHQPPDARRPASSVGTPEHLAPAPRLHPPGARHSRETPAPSAPPPPALGEVLEWVRNYGTQGVSADHAPNVLGQPKQTPRFQLPKEQRKFHKFDPDHPAPEPPVAAGSGLPRIHDPFSADEAATGDLSFDGYPGGITSEQIAFIRRLRQETPERSPWFPLGVAVVFFVLVAAAFLAGHVSWSKVPSVAPTQESVPEKTVEKNEVFKGLSAGVENLIDQAAAAEKTKDYLKAIELLERAQHDAGHVYGLNYHLATLCYKANEITRVLPLLNLSIAEGEEVAACYSFRGLPASPSGGEDPGPGDLEKATRLDPFNARYPYVWGESLRRAGKLDQALTQFRRAADRVEDLALAGKYALKVRLTQIELGQQEEFAPEMATQLKLTPPPVDWLFTAAAIEMHRNHFPAAAELLARVRSLIGPTATASELQDAFYANFAHESELASFFEMPTSVDSLSAAILP